MAQYRDNGINARERAIYEQRRRREKQMRKKKRAKMIAYASRITLLALISSFLFGIVLTCALAYDFSKAPEKYEYTLDITLNGEKVKGGYNIKTSDNTCYVSLGSVAKLTNCKIMGDVNVMSAVFDDNNSVSFYIDTPVYSVNGISRTMDKPSFFSGIDGDVYIPVDFFNGTFEGIELSGEKKGKRIDYTLSITDGFAPVFGNVSPVSIPAELKNNSKFIVPANKFVADLSAYEKYMNPENRDEYITLINTSHPLGENYIPDDLIDISYTRNDRKAVQMREYAAKALDAMFIEMKANGFTDVSVTSAYRSYDYQQQLFNNSLNTFKQSYDYDTAYAKTAAQIAIPGTSEHQSGLCADLHNLPSASQRFEAEEAYKWLYTHCADFGFILRFPKDKSDITGIIFEPWHYRYVGRYHAQKIMKSGLCLEEYCEQNGF